MGDSGGTEDEQGALLSSAPTVAATMFHPDSAVQYIGGYGDTYSQPPAISYQILSTSDAAAAAINLSNAVPLFTTPVPEAPDPSTATPSSTPGAVLNLMEPPQPPALPPLSPLTPPSPPTSSST